MGGRPVQPPPQGAQTCAGSSACASALPWPSHEGRRPHTIELVGNGPLGPSAKTTVTPKWLIDVREQFLVSPDAPLPESVRAVVAESWRRSVDLGVDPLQMPPLEFDPDALAEYRESHPLATLMPVVRRLLAEDADEAEHIVAVGDALGRLLWVEGHHGLRSRAEAMHFVEGALWSERGAGTNAPGTALALAAPVRIAAAEHFGVEVQRWSCVAAPVRSPLDGTVIGVVDLTGGTDVAGPHSLALVRACAAAMESQLLADARAHSGLPIPSSLAALQRGAVLAGSRSPPDRGRTQFAVPEPTGRSRGRWRSGVPIAPSAQATLQLLGMDAGLLHLPERTVALSRRHAEIVWLLTRSGRGMTVQGLDAALHDDGSHLATIRSEMFRLRKLLGNDVLGSRPYRLLVPVTSDVDRVRQLLARGAVLKALELLRGPPLQDSQAPGVVAAREDLMAELRAAVLSSRSPAALERWTGTAEGHDDDEAWQALAKALPYGSPKRATARAHMARLATLLQARVPQSSPRRLGARRASLG